MVDVEADSRWSKRASMGLGRMFGRGGNDIKIPYEPSYDGLRGIGVIAVIIGHLGYADGAIYAIDAFFLLSGFLITSLCLKAIDRNGSLRLRSFWSRRFRRLGPAILLLLTAVAFYARFVANPGELGNLRGEGISAIFYVNNWYLIHNGISYTDLFRLPSPIEHIWTLSVEEQFYVIWPVTMVVVLWFTRGWEMMRRRKALFFTAVTMTVMSISWVEFLRATNTPSELITRFYYGTDTRAFALLAGSSMAIAVTIWGRPRSDRFMKVMDHAGWIGLFTVIGFWLTATVSITKPTTIPFYISDAGVLTLVWILGDDRSIWSRKVLSNRPLVLTGLISYGIYLWHWPIIVWLTPERLGFGGIGRDIFVVVLSIAVAALTFVLVELPILKGTPSGTPAKVAAPLAMALVGLLFFVSTNGASSVDDQILGKGGKKVDGLEIAIGTPLVAPPGHPHILVVGDSQAVTVGAGLMALQKPEAISVMNRGTVGCNYMLDGNASRYEKGYVQKGEPACPRWPIRWKGYVDSYRPNVAILISGEPGLGERLINGVWESACHAGYEDQLRNDTIKALQLISSRGADPYVLTSPYIDLSRTPFAGKLHTYFRSDTDCINQVYREAAAQVPGARVLDLNGWMCKHDGPCDVVKDGVTLRTDGIHFKDKGAELVSRWILSQLSPPKPTL